MVTYLFLLREFDIVGVPVDGFREGGIGRREEVFPLRYPSDLCLVESAL